MKRCDLTFRLNRNKKESLTARAFAELNVPKCPSGPENAETSFELCWEIHESFLGGISKGSAVGDLEGRSATMPADMDHSTSALLSDRSMKPCAKFLQRILP